MKPVRVLVLSLAMSGLFSCIQISTPFQSSKALPTVSSDTVVVGITHVTLNDNRKGRKAFWRQTINVVNSLDSQMGYLGHRVRRDLGGNEGWTMTVWENDDAIEKFITSASHTQAIRMGIPGVKEARFVRVSISKDSLPMSWDEAEKAMNEKGRTRTY